MNKLLSLLVRKLGDYVPRKGGEELSFKCAVCHDHRHRFDVNLKKKLYHCFNCGVGGSLEEMFPLMDGAMRNIPIWLSKTFESKEIKPLPHVKGIWIDTPHGQWLHNRGVFPIPTEWGVTRDGRIFIPVEENGKLVCWLARAIDGRLPKELSPKASISNKSHFLYGYDACDVHVNTRPMVLVEGVFDYLRVKSFGFNLNCLALMGSQISAIQIGKLFSLGVHGIVLMMDGDDAGRKATRKIAGKLAERMNPYNIEEIYLPEGKDPDELTREEFDVRYK